MEEKQRKELIKKIIEEQDIVALYTYDGFNKSLGIMQEYSNGILYSELKKFILQNSEMLKKFTTKNLYTLLASTYDESEKQIINEQIAERLEKEDFFCEDIDSEVFLHPIHTYDSYGKIDKDVINKINIELEKQLKELGKEYEIIDKNIKNYPDAANFLKYYKDGIFNNDKIAMINKFIEKDSKALEYMNDGYEWIVDIDLEKFFDNVPRDRLLRLVSDVVKDGNVVSLVNKFLKAGVMIKGNYEETTIGTPQGGPLSPLLSNIMLNLLNKELEARKLCFTRYADDTIILVKSEKAANRLMASITKYIENKLKLKVNTQRDR